MTDDEPLECVYCGKVIEDWYEEEAFMKSDYEAAHQRCHDDWENARPEKGDGWV